MSSIEPGDELYPVRGDRPPDGHIDGFATWDPTNYFGFRADDEQFPPPSEDEALFRREQASSDLAEDINRHMDLTSDE